MLDLLTVVIYTYKRHEEVLTSLSYWDSIGVQVICIDGSPTPLSNDDLKNYTSRINYIHHPTSILERLKYVSTIIKTKYVALVPDDEVFTLSGINMCLEELSENNLISCGGQTLGFGFDGRNTTFQYLYDSYLGYNNLSENIYERILYRKEKLEMPTIYSIMVTDYWQKVIRFISKSNIYCLGNFESQFELGTKILGKSKRIDHLFWLRNCYTPPSRNNDAALDMDNLMINWWVANDDNKLQLLDEYKNFLKDNDIFDDRIIEAVRVSLDSYVLSVKVDNERANGKYRSSFKNFLLPKIPKNILNTYNRLVNKPHYLTISNLFTSLDKIGVKYNENEIRCLIPIIKKYKI